MAKKSIAASAKAHTNWLIWENEGGTYDIEQVQLAVLVNIRDELQKLNRLLHCENFTMIPALLRMIRSNTAKPKRRKRKPV